MKTKPPRNVVIPDVSILTDREREAWGHRVAGKPAREAAEAMGCSIPSVYMFWSLAMLRAKNGRATRAMIVAEREAREEAARIVPRCRCGLALPCNGCLPASAAEWRGYAGSPGE